MPIRFDKKAITFLYRFFVKGRTDARQIPYIPSKTRLMGENTETKLPRAMPESKGISSKCLLSMLSKLEADKTSTVHCLGVLADGAVICEACAPGSFYVQDRNGTRYRYARRRGKAFCRYAYLYHFK